MASSRHLRWPLDVVSLLCLLAGVAASAAWVRSYWAVDRVYWARFGLSGSLESGRGYIHASIIRNRQPQGTRLAALDHWVGDVALIDPNVDEWVRGWEAIRGPGFAYRAGQFGPDATARWVLVRWPLLAAACAFLPAMRALWIYRCRRKQRLLRSRLCPECGYDVRATQERCPECGHALRPVSSDATDARRCDERVSPPPARG